MADLTVTLKDERLVVEPQGLGMLAPLIARAETAVTAAEAIVENITFDGLDVAIGDPGGAKATLIGLPMLRRRNPGPAESIFLAGAGNDTTTSAQACLGTGKGALASITTGGNNVAYGFGALGKITTGGANFAAGTGALGEALDVIDSIAIGFGALAAAISGVGDVAIGMLALNEATGAYSNTTVGDSGLRRTTTGGVNAAFGYTAMDQNTTGSENVATGAAANFANTTANGNTANGFRSMANRSDTGFNTATGHVSLENGSGKWNVANGFGSLQYSGPSEGHTAAGTGSGAAATGGSRSGWFGLSSGQNGAVQKVDPVNSTALGARTNTWKDHQVVIGDTDVTEMVLAGQILPRADGTQNLGSGSLRFGTVYASTGAINTSDRDAKQQVGAIPDDWLDAWGDVEWVRFKFNDSVAAKGDDARWHVGAVAQQVHEAFAARALDAFAIGLCCYDNWEAETVAVHELEEFEVTRIGPKGEEITDIHGHMVPTGAVTTVLDGGVRWGLRYDECQVMEAAWQRRRIARLEEALAALQSAGA